MKILCGGVIDGPTSVFSHTLNIDCLDATPAGTLAAELFVALMLHGSSPSSVTSTRQICYASVSALRKIFLTPAMSSFLNTAADRGSTVNTFTAFSADAANNMLFEAQEYVQGEEKLCTSTAFVYHRIPMSRIKTTASSSLSATSTDGASAALLPTLQPSSILGLATSSSSSTGDSETNKNNNGSEFTDTVSNSPCFVTLWLMCHLLPEEGVTINAPKRLLDLSNASSILARWSELCLRGDGNFRFYVAGGGNNNNKNININGQAAKVWSELTMAFVGSALDECAGEFGDCRHAAMEPRFAGE